jgi:predicted ester cyclase
MGTLIGGLVRRFYSEVWNQRSEAVAREILHPEFQFRGSLDAVRTGPEGFISYMHAVHDALGDYTCDLMELVETEEKAVGKLRFHGVHRAPFFGVDATGKTLEWAGAAFFTRRDNQIGSLWVLGDIDALKTQLGIAGSAKFEK